MRYAVIAKFSPEGSDWYIGNCPGGYAVTDDVRFAPRFWTRRGAEDYLALVQGDPAFKTRRMTVSIQVKKLWWL